MATRKTKPRDQALTEAAQEQRGPVLSAVRGMLGVSDEAEDVLQDVLAEYVEAYDLGLSVESIGGWFVRVARNKVVDRFRQRKVRDDYRFLVEATETEASDVGNEWMREWLQTEIVGALEALPAEQRAVFVAHELEGRSFDEISAETGVGVNTLLSRKRYAVLALRKHLKEVYDELGNE